MLSESAVAIAPSTYYAGWACPVSDAGWADAHLANALFDLWRANRDLYGAEKLTTAAQRAGYNVGRDQVVGLMRVLGIAGVRRGKHCTVTTKRAPGAPKRPDLVKRAWSSPTRPDQWRVADFTYLWTLAGLVYVSFVTGVLSRRILGWSVSFYRLGSSLGRRPPSTCLSVIQSA